jgi:hypothetical protein
MLSSDHWLLGNPLIIVPIGGNAIWASEWQTLAVIFVAAIVAWLVIDAVLEERLYLHNRVLAVLAKSSLMFIAATVLVVCWAVALTLATLVGVPPVPISP